MENNKYQILVIEDNPGDYFIVEHLLTEQFANPYIVHNSNYKEAMSTISGADVLFDVILLDLTLPDMSGQRLIEEMLKVAPSLPIIILTGFADIDFSKRSISQGISDYLLKDDLNAVMLCKSILFAIERKKMNLDLQASERRYSDIFYLSPYPMWVYDPLTFKFLQVNNATLGLYGYNETEFLHMTLVDILRPGDVFKPGELAGMQDHGAGKFKTVSFHQKKSGEIIEVEIFSNPIIINNHNFRSVIAIDVTEKNLYEHKLIKAIISTQEDERYEIGGELHDNVCQILAASLWTLSVIRQSCPTHDKLLFEGCNRNITLALDEIRKLSHRLAPAFFDGLTLEEAFSQLFDNYNIEKKLDISMDFDQSVSKYVLSREIQLNLYRILQEQLSNILKYAKANLIKINVAAFNNTLTMKIFDNGIGFKADKIKEGIGLANMRRRAELFQGNFEIETSPGSGCEISVTIPL